MEDRILKNNQTKIVQKKNGEYDPLNTFPHSDNVGKEIEKFIVEAMKYEDNMRIEDKINFTAFIITYRDFLTNLEDFYEEECHLTLVNWIYRLKKNLASGSPDKRFGELLYNIILIFENFPINRNDILSLKIFEKLNKIRQYMKAYDLSLSGRLQRLLNYWKTFINDDEELRKLTGRKRLRTKDLEENEKVKTNAKIKFLITEAEEDTEPGSEENIEHDSTHTQSNSYLGIIRKSNSDMKKKKEKKIIWNEENIKTVVQFNIDDAPIEITRKNSKPVDSLTKSDFFGAMNTINYGDLELQNEFSCEEH